jgi:glycosyltransferase involved in cell wall biosynthesis
MKIGIDAHTIGNQLTGNEVYITNLIRNLAKIDNKNRYTLYFTKSNALNRNFINQPNFQLKLIKPNYPLLRIPLIFPMELWRNYIDLLHVQYIAPPICPCKFVVTIHDTSYEFYPQFFKATERFRLAWIMPYMAKKAVKIFTVSENSKKDIINLYKVDPEKVVVTCDAVNENFKPIRQGMLLEKIKNKYKLSHNFILYVGNLQPRKNLSGLIKAYCRLKKDQNIKHKLVIVGQKAWLYSDIFNIAKDLMIEDEIIFTGYVQDEDLLLLYNAADVFVYPSFYEGFGLPVLEAMACGTPVITSNTSSFPEVVGDAGLMVNPYEINEIAKAIYDVIVNSELKKKLSKKGLQRAKLFSWEDTARKTLKIYEEVKRM